MRLTNEPLTEAMVDEVVQFLRDSNPFAQKTWGWDTGRFIDWRWGFNSLRVVQEPGWFAEHCRVFRNEGTIRSVAIAEEGTASACIITGDEDPEAVQTGLADLQQAHAKKGVGVHLEFANSAHWLAEILAAAGFTEDPLTGHEWEYDLSTVAAASVPEGFTIESLGDERETDYAGVAECIQWAFNTTHDVAAVLRNLEANPLFRPELSVFARSHEGRIAAYCRGTVDPASGVCGIDPVCTHPEFHRLGLGKAVVSACFEAQRNLGGRFSYIGSDRVPAPGTFLYESLGPSHRTDCCEWTWPAS